MNTQKEKKHPHPIWLCVTSEERKRIREAAAAEDLPMSKFARKHVIRAAETLLKKRLTSQSQ